MSNIALTGGRVRRPGRGPDRGDRFSPMSYEPSPRGAELRDNLLEFMETSIYPAEEVYEEQMIALGDPHGHPRIVEDLKAEARSRGLWNLFMPHPTEWTPDPVSNLDSRSAARAGRGRHRAG